MPFLQLTLEIGAADPAPFEEALFAVGASSVTLEDAADDPILEPAPGTLPLWPTVTINALFSNAVERGAIVRGLEEILGALPAHRFEHVEDRVWEREWLKDFKPMRFGERLWVCPGGMMPPSVATPHALSPTPVLIQLDPGLAFGTGTHATTALCLEWLDGADLLGKEVIDYGCGSGILAIAALQLGAHSAVGIDIDAQALTASRANAERNDVSDRLILHAIDGPPRAADVVLANILAGPLDELAPTLTALVKPGGQLVLSGILENQAPHLAQRYGAWFDMGAPKMRDNWVRLVGTKRS